MYLLFSGLHWSDTEPRVVPGSKQTKKDTSMYGRGKFESNIYVLLFGACLKRVCNLFKSNGLSPHCPCSGPSGCCWAAPGYFSSHHEARQPYWPALRSAPSASSVTIHHGTLGKQNDMWEIFHHLNHVRLLTSAVGDSFTHRALTDTLIIKKKGKKKPKDLTAQLQDINQVSANMSTGLSASQSTH